MERYNPKIVEEKWQKIWAEENYNKTTSKKKIKNFTA